MTETDGPRRVLFLTDRPDRWAAHRGALAAADGLSVTVDDTATATAVESVVDCVRRPIVGDDHAVDGRCRGRVTGGDRQPVGRRERAAVGRPPLGPIGEEQDPSRPV